MANAETFIEVNSYFVSGRKARLLDTEYAVSIFKIVPIGTRDVNGREVPLYNIIDGYGNVSITTDQSGFDNINRLFGSFGSVKTYTITGKYARNTGEEYLKSAGDKTQVVQVKKEIKKKSLVNGNDTTLFYLIGLNDRVLLITDRDGHDFISGRNINA